MRRTLVLTVGLLGAACAARNLDAPPEGGGVVLASVTMGYSGSFWEGISFRFKGEGGGKFRLDSAVPETIYPMIESTPDKGLERENGLLYAIAKPAGEYRLVEVQIHATPTMVARVSEPVTFRVAEGETVYIGNLHVELCHLQGAGGPYYVAGGHASARDRFERDLPLLRARFPWLSDRIITRRVMDDRAVRAGTLELCRKCP